MDNKNNNIPNFAYESKVHRCSICNSVSVADIETDLGDFKDHMSFTPDPKDPRHFICIECAEAINEVQFEYELEDEYGND